MKNGQRKSALMVRRKDKNKNLVRYRNQEIIKRSLKDEGLPFFWITENDVSKRSYAKDDGKVKISTIDSSKGIRL
jgi:hypothetical protein